MADIFQEEFNPVDEYTEDFSGDNEKREERATEEEDNQDFVNVISESSEPSEPQRIEPSLAELANSDFIHNRQLAARKILDFINDSKSNKDELHSVVSIMCKLANDEEPMVRAELMEQIPAIASFCREHGADLEKIIRQQLVPITVKLVTDEQVQVRKVGQAFLLVLLERNLIDNSQLTEWICPLIAQLAASASSTQDQTVKRTEAIDVMCKMASLVGKDITIQFFLEPFASICSEANLALQQVCLVNFGDFCKVVGTEATETILFPKFLSLCLHEKCLLRKACVEAFVDISNIVTSESRKVLADYYIKLLDDSDEWQFEPVRIAALQCLGGFITTFANPQKTGLHYDGGTWRLIDKVVMRKTNAPQKEDKFELVNETAVVSSTFTNQNSVELIEFSQSPRRDVDEFGDHTLETDSEENSNSDKNSKLNSDEIGHCLSSCQHPGENCENTKNIHMDPDEKSHENSILESIDEVEQNIVLPLKSLEIDDDCGFVHNKISEMHKEYFDYSHSDDDDNRTFVAGDAKKVSSETNVLLPPKLESNSPSVILSCDSQLGLVNGETDPCDSGNIFNSFQYWQTPLPELDLDVDEIRKKICRKRSFKPRSIKTEQIAQQSLNDSNCNRFWAYRELLHEKKTEINQQECELKYDAQEYAKMAYLKGFIVDEAELASIDDQDIVPPELVKIYLSMIDSVLNHTQRANELYQHCAFSFPGVAYTLGRLYWPYLKGLCVYLTSHVQWRIRKTVASYLHELAVIIGPENTALDLLPLFFGLLKDVDEVRLALLMHLSDFLKHLKPLERNMFLPLVEEFLKMDNERNWRFRYTLAQQLITTVPLYEPCDVFKYLFPIASMLIADRISSVRHEALRLMAVILKHLVKNDLECAECSLDKVKQLFRESSKWLHRQMYVILCEQIAMNRCFDTDEYIQKVLPNILSLTWDAVPNVRLAVSRCISCTLIPLGYLMNIESENFELMSKVMFSLRNDIDKDVRYFAQLVC